MKKMIYFLLCVSTLSLTAQSEFGDEMASILENMKSYTLAVAEAMPEEKFDYRPTEKVRSFREQLHHIGSILEFQTNYPMKAVKIDPEKWPEQRKKIFAKRPAATKEEMKKFLNQRFDSAIELFKSLKESDYKKKFTFFFFPDKPERNVTTVSMALRDHITHHRAQAIVYLRLNDIEPPFYKLF